jgi:hypothetical protein
VKRPPEGSLRGSPFGSQVGVPVGPDRHYPKTCQATLAFTVAAFVR